jgi:deoxycytidine triphosphate deaminase
MLSNQELLRLLRCDTPIVKNLGSSNFEDGLNSPLQPASIDLHVGEILVPRERNADGRLVRYLKTFFGDGPIESCVKYSIPSGGSVVLLTREEIALPAGYAGLMFPKSSGLAERGILMTNFGHVDPGFTGKLRYAVINLGSEKYDIAVGHSIACLCVFRLTPAASPDWSLGRQHNPNRDSEFVNSLSPELLSLNRITREAKRVAKDTLITTGVWVTIGTSSVAALLGIATTAATMAAVWLSLIEPRLDKYDAMIADLQRASAKGVEQIAPSPPKREAPRNIAPRPPKSHRPDR